MSYLPVEVLNFLKIKLIFNIFYCFWMFVNKLCTYIISHINCAHVSKCKKCFNVKSLTYCFHMEKKILADFQNCISVPLITRKPPKFETKVSETICVDLKRSCAYSLHIDLLRTTTWKRFLRKKTYHCPLL